MRFTIYDLRFTRLAVVLAVLAFGGVARGAVVQAAGVSFADVSSAYASCSPGDTLILPIGSATWAQPLFVRKGPLSIQGAGTNLTVIYGSRIVPATNGVTITGMTFVITNNAGPAVQVVPFRYPTNAAQYPFWDVLYSTNGAKGSWHVWASDLSWPPSTNGDIWLTNGSSALPSILFRMRGHTNF